MSSTVASAPSRMGLAFFTVAAGKKVVMAVTGIILFAFVVAHLLGNLQIFLGREKLNAYAELLRHNEGLLWVARVILLAALGLHVLAAVQLTRLKREARPERYRTRRDLQASYASRTMMWSGPIILAFVIYHILHLTFGTLHGSFTPNDVYANVVSGFQNFLVSLVYIVAMILLGMHLQHGLWSLSQSLGLGNPDHSRKAKLFARVLALLIVVGNISIPIAVLTGLVRP
jgi:succinate dehydrogenase / fumarate reductase, cytochrome b subunit